MNGPRPCDQCKQAPATCYGLDRCPGGWGGHYCDPCCERLGFTPIDRDKYSVETTEVTR